MKALRTDDNCFDKLADYPFRPHYLMVDDTEGGELRMHYVDEGPRDGAVVLLLHGEPSWSYLYRKMIPPLAEAGFRVVAPDLIGFGRSDKPSERSDYTYERHLGWLRSLLDQLKLSDITLFCQDWGGLLGLRLVAEQPERFARVMAGNTALPTGEQDMGEGFKAWQQASQNMPVFNTGKIINSGTVSDLPPEVIAAYDAPFPHESYKSGARQFPMLVPSSADNPDGQANKRAWQSLMKFDKPFITVFSDKDPVTAGGDKALQKLIPGCQGQAHVTIKDAGHFLQEDKGEELAERLIAFIKQQ